MLLFYHFTKVIAEKLILLINEQADSYNKPFSEADPFLQKWKNEINEATSTPFQSYESDLPQNNPSTSDEALEMEALGAKYFDYFHGLQVIKFSQVVLCSSLIQMARQTLNIALHQSSLEDQPLGRLIGNQYLRDVVRHGRNHCMHFEEDQPCQHTLAFLKQLEQDFGDAFPYSKKPKESLAIELIAILGWTSYEIYAKDIKSLLPTKDAGVTVKRASRA